MKEIGPAHTFGYATATIMVYYASSGEGLPRHEHAYSHGTQCISGRIAIRKEGKEVILTKRDGPVNLKANEWHEIEALEDNTAFINVFESGKVS